MKQIELKVKVTFLEEVLGSAPSSPDLMTDYVAANAPDALSMKEEIEATSVDEVVEDNMTIFPKLEDGTPHAWDYQWKGFFKDACGMLRRVSGTHSSKLSAYKKIIDGLVFINERKIPYENWGGEIGTCTRPLRASTAQGERVAIAKSETVPAGSTLTFTIRVLRDSDKQLVLEWLDYGIFKGFSQWSNSGKGRFTYEILSDEIVDFNGKSTDKKKEDAPKKKPGRKAKTETVKETEETPKKKPGRKAKTSDDK